MAQFENALVQNYYNAASSAIAALYKRKLEDTINRIKTYREARGVRGGLVEKELAEVTQGFTENEQTALNQVTANAWMLQAQSQQQKEQQDWYDRIYKQQQEQDIQDWYRLQGAYTAGLPAQRNLGDIAKETHEANVGFGESTEGYWKGGQWIQGEAPWGYSSYGINLGGAPENKVTPFTSSLKETPASRVVGTPWLTWRTRGG